MLGACPCAGATARSGHAGGTAALGQCPPPLSDRPSPHHLSSRVSRSMMGAFQSGSGSGVAGLLERSGSHCYRLMVHMNAAAEAVLAPPLPAELVENLQPGEALGSESDPRLL